MIKNEKGEKLGLEKAFPSKINFGLTGSEINFGLTKREYIATMIAQGRVGYYTENLFETPDKFVEKILIITDALLHGLSE